MVELAARLRAAWDRFYELTKKYVFLLFFVVLLEDRAQGWANDQIDKYAPDAAQDGVRAVLTAPFILVAAVIAFLMALAYWETRGQRNPHAAATRNELINGMTKDERLWWAETGVRDVWNKYAKTETALRKEIASLTERLKAADAQVQGSTAERDLLTKRQEEMRLRHEAAVASRNARLRELEPERDQLRTDLTNLRARLDSVAAMPSWLEKAHKQDADDLRGAVALIDEQSQNYHVVFDLEDKLEPGIFFRFMILNTSVYTVEIPSVEGILQIDFKVYPGAWTIPLNQPKVFPRRSRYNFFFKFVLNTEQAQQQVRALVAESRSDDKEICFELNNVKLKVQASEDPHIATELRFPQQYWRPSHVRGR